jgi:hypothetical protein
MRSALFWDITPANQPTVVGWLAGFLSFLIFLTLENWTDMLSRNVGKGLPIDAA